MAGALRFMNLTTVCYLISDSTNFYMKISPGSVNNTGSLSMAQPPDWSALSDLQAWSRYRFRFHTFDREGSPMIEVAMESDFGPHMIYEDVHFRTGNIRRLVAKDAPALDHVEPGQISERRNGTTFKWELSGYSVALSSTINNDHICSSGQAVLMQSGDCSFTCYPKVSFISQTTVIMVSGRQQVIVSPGAQGMVPRPNKHPDRGIAGKPGPCAPAPLFPWRGPKQPAPSEDFISKGRKEPGNATSTGRKVTDKTTSNTTKAVMGDTISKERGQPGGVRSRKIGPPGSNIGLRRCGPPIRAEPEESFTMYRYRYEMGDTELEGVVLRSLSDGRYLTCRGGRLVLTGESEVGCRGGPVLQADSRMFIRDPSRGSWALRCHENPEMALSILNGRVTISKRKPDDFNFKEAKTRFKPSFRGKSIPGRERCQRNPAQLICGSQQYDPVRSLCCEGTVTSKLGMMKPACCGKKGYNTATHACCGGVIKTSLAGKERRSCGSTVYSNTCQICCKGVLHARENKLARCCGSQRYDPFRSLCCEGTVTSKLGMMKPACCGKRGYNTATHACCGGVIKTRLAGKERRSCGSTVYSNTCQICCKGVLHARENILARCCGSQKYNSRDSGCCMDKVFSRLPGKIWKCCAGKLYDSSKRTCCSGTFLYKRHAYGRTFGCCGRSLYDRKTHQCRNGVVLKRLRLGPDREVQYPPIRDPRSRADTGRGIRGFEPPPQAKK